MLCCVAVTVSTSSVDSNGSWPGLIQRCQAASLCNAKVQNDGTGRTHTGGGGGLTVTLYVIC